MTRRLYKPLYGRGKRTRKQEDASNPQRDRDRGKGDDRDNPDPNRSAQSKASARTNQRKRQKGQERWTDSPQGKRFHRKLGRLNKRGGTQPTSISGEVQQALRDLDNTTDNSNLIGLIRRGTRR